MVGVSGCDDARADIMGGRMGGEVELGKLAVVVEDEVLAGVLECACRMGGGVCVG